MARKANYTKEKVRKLHRKLYLTAKKVERRFIRLQQNTTWDYKESLDIRKAVGRRMSESRMKENFAYGLMRRG